MPDYSVNASNVMTQSFEEGGLGAMRGNHHEGIRKNPYGHEQVVSVGRWSSRYVVDGDRLHKFGPETYWSTP